MSWQLVSQCPGIVGGWQWNSVFVPAWWGMKIKNIVVTLLPLSSPHPSSRSPSAFHWFWAGYRTSSSSSFFLRVSSLSLYQLYPSLSRFSIALEEWNKLVFENLFLRQREIWARLEGIQKCLPMAQNHFLLQLEKKSKARLGRDTWPNRNILVSKVQNGSNTGWRP